MKQTGYTLIELIVVISIIGVLLSVSIPAFSQFNAPQEFRAASLLVKSDLRSVHNKAVNGVTSQRGIDRSVPPDGVADAPAEDSRVYWVARFENGKNTYETGACQKSIAIAERWTNGECSDIKTRTLPSKIEINVCAGSCTGYAVFFSPIYGNVEAYEANDIKTLYPVPPAGVGRTLLAITGANPQVILTMTSTAVANRSIVLSIDQDGSLTETCKNGATVISCQ